MIKRFVLSELNILKMGPYRILLVAAALNKKSFTVILCNSFFRIFIAAAFYEKKIKI